MTPEELAALAEEHVGDDGTPLEIAAAVVAEEGITDPVEQDAFYGVLRAISPALTNPGDGFGTPEP